MDGAEEGCNSLGDESRGPGLAHAQPTAVERDAVAHQDGVQGAAAVVRVPPVMPVDMPESAHTALEGAKGVPPAPWGMKCR